jgi:hypothetical protein
MNNGSMEPGISKNNPSPLRGASEFTVFCRRSNGMYLMEIYGYL